MSGETLLPANRTAWETSLSLTSAARRPIDADLIRRVRDPWLCPVEFLPFLAHAMGVKLWFDDWSEFRKRSIIAIGVQLRAKEGTLGAVEDYLSFVDVTVLRALRPPSKIFLAGGLTDAERKSYIARLPQIRIYSFQTTDQAPAYRSYLRLGHAFLGHMFVQASRGSVLYGRRATIARPGEAEVPARVDILQLPDLSIAERVTITTDGSKRRYLGRDMFLGHAHLRANRADQNTVTVRLNQGAPVAFMALAGSRLQDVRPVQVRETRTAPIGRFFLGRDFLGAKRPHLRASNGPRMIYDRLALLDPAVDPAVKKGRSYLGHCRFGVRPFTAELLLDVPLSRSRFRIGVGARGFLRGFLRPASLEELTRARVALRAAKAIDDTILIDTEVQRRVRLGDFRTLGSSLRLGQFIRRI